MWCIIRIYAPVNGWLITLHLPLKMERLFAPVYKCVIHIALLSAMANELAVFHTWWRLVYLHIRLSEIRN